jgi:DNA repair exonuclease SbcCD ATPase subunit
MNDRDKTYPDISDILALKRQGRQEISKRSFGTKIAMVEAMRERLAPLKRLRESRKSVETTAAMPAKISHPED